MGITIRIVELLIRRLTGEQLLHDSLYCTGNEIQAGTESLCHCTRLIYTEKLDCLVFLSISRNEAAHSQLFSVAFRFGLVMKSQLGERCYMKTCFGFGFHQSRGAAGKWIYLYINIDG